MMTNTYNFLIRQIYLLAYTLLDLMNLHNLHNLSIRIFLLMCALVIHCASPTFLHSFHSFFLSPSL